MVWSLNRVVAPRRSRRDEYGAGCGDLAQGTAASAREGCRGPGDLKPGPHGPEPWSCHDRTRPDATASAQLDCDAGAVLT
jgi:hypothetical protein